MPLPTYPEVSDVLTRHGRTLSGLKATMVWAERVFSDKVAGIEGLTGLSVASLDNLQTRLNCDVSFNTARNAFVTALPSLQEPSTPERGLLLLEAQNYASDAEAAIRVFKKSKQTLDAAEDAVLNTFVSGITALQNTSMGVKACVKIALPAATQNVEDLLVVGSEELPELLAMMPGLASSLPKTTVADWYSRHAAKLAKMAHSVGNFNSKLSNTSTSVALRINPVRGHALAALSSTAVDTPTRVGFFGNASDFIESFFFCGAFLFEGKLTTVIELAVTKHPALARALSNLDLPSDIFEEVVQNYVSSTLAPNDRIPQVLWPVGETYHALSPLPSVAVLNALVGRNYHSTHNSRMPGTWLPIEGDFTVGGANPQNAGPFNQACGGKYPIFKAGIPSFPADTGKKLLRATWSRDWLRLPKKTDSLIKELETDWTARPFEQRQKVASKLARGMTAVALSFADALRELQDEIPEAFDAAFWTKHQANPAVRYVRKDDYLDWVDQLAGAILNKFAGLAQSLENSLDKQTLLLDALKVALKEHTA
jgi:hypothetical protein